MVGQSKKSLKNVVYAGIVALALAGAKEARADFDEQPLTNPAYQAHPSISGDRIVWQDERNGNFDIYMWDSVNGEQPVCIHPAPQYSPAISGNKVVWREYRSGYTDIYMWDTVNGEQPVCIHPASQSSPVISGDVIVWVDDRDWYSNRRDIYMWDPINGEQPVCTHLAHQEYPAIDIEVIEPNSYRIIRIVWQDKRNGNWDIYMWDSVNGEREICANLADQAHPSISADKIVWQDKRNGNWDIYMWDSVNGEQAVCTHEGNQLFPSISGDRIVWEDGRNGNPDIYMWDPVNGELAVSTHPLSQKLPCISGDSIVWQDNRNGNWDIYMAKIPFRVKTLKADLNNDGIIDFKDFVIFANQWLTTEPWYRGRRFVEIYFPLQVGNSWTYTNYVGDPNVGPGDPAWTPPRPGSELTFTIIGTEEIDGHTYYKFNDYFNIYPPPPNGEYRVTRGRETLFRYDPTADIVIMRSGSKDIIRYNFTGDEWETGDASGWCRLKQTGVTCVVPAGEFSDCINFQFDWWSSGGPDAYAHGEYLAANVGNIKFVRPGGNFLGLSEGERVTFMLKSYTIIPEPAIQGIVDLDPNLQISKTLFERSVK